MIDPRGQLQEPAWKRLLGGGLSWLDRVDPGVHRRIKGLRLVTAFGLAWMMGAVQGPTLDLPGQAALSVVAAGLALWASVSEGQTTRAASSRDLALLVLAGVAGATLMTGLRPALAALGRAGPEFALVIGAFLVGYLKRYGVLGSGIGSQIYIGELLAYGTRLVPADLPMVGVAGVIAAVAAIVPRLLSGPAEHPALPPPLPAAAEAARARELRMGLQAGIAALVIVLLNAAVGLEESAWAITACTYVIAGTATGTMQRVFRRIIGTAVGVPIGLAFLPVAAHLHVLIWIAAAIAMVVYAVALPERYDIACGAYAFALLVTLAAGGESSALLLAARAWETLIGAAIGLAMGMVVLPLRTVPRE